MFIELSPVCSVFLILTPTCAASRAVIMKWTLEAQRIRLAWMAFFIPAKFPTLA